MKLSNETKQLIREEYEEFKESMYAGKSLKERQTLDQFFTPPEISIRLIEDLSDLSGNILDPACGSGNLLAAALIAGADSDKVFGNDYDQVMVEE
jgi:type I restriction-modification system DNA methylase subunit